MIESTTFCPFGNVSDSQEQLRSGSVEGTGCLDSYYGGASGNDHDFVRHFPNEVFIIDDLHVTLEPIWTFSRGFGRTRRLCNIENLSGLQLGVKGCN